MKAVVAAFNQEKALVGAFSVITNLRMDIFKALMLIAGTWCRKVTMTWEAGLLACKLIRFLQVVVTYASTYVLVALSIDRYDAITHPMAFTGSCK